MAHWDDCTTNPFNDSEKRSRCKTSGPGADLWPGYGNPAYSVQDIDNYCILWFNLGKTMTKRRTKSETRPCRNSIWRCRRLPPFMAAVRFGRIMVVGDPGIDYGANFRLPYAGTLDPRPSATGPAYTTAHPNANAEDPWFESTPYIGAFSATDNWADKPWTALHQLGYFKASVHFLR